MSGSPRFRRARSRSIRAVFPPLACVPVNDTSVAFISDDHTYPGAHPAVRSPLRSFPTRTRRWDAPRVQIRRDRARRYSVSKLTENLQHDERFAATDSAVAVAVSAATSGATSLRSALERCIGAVPENGTNASGPLRRSHRSASERAFLKSQHARTVAECSITRAVAADRPMT